MAFGEVVVQLLKLAAETVHQISHANAGACILAVARSFLRDLFRACLTATVG